MLKTVQFFYLISMRKCRSQLDQTNGNFLVSLIYTSVQALPWYQDVYEQTRSGVFRVMICTDHSYRHSFLRPILLVSSTPKA